MERVRADLIRRARIERHGDLEQGLPHRHGVEEDERHQGYSGRLAGLSRPPIPRLFGQRDEGTTSQEAGQFEVLESPKSPEFAVRAGRSPLNRFTLPSISQVWTGRFLRIHSQTGPEPVDETHLTSNTQIWEMPRPPEPATHARSTVRAVSSHYSTTEGPDPTESSPSSRSSEHRRRRRRRHRHEAMRYGRRKRRGKAPTRFLFCFPWIKSRRMRAYILRCFVSGLFLVVLLTTCEFAQSSFRSLVLGWRD